MELMGFSHTAVVLDAFSLNRAMDIKSENAL